MARRLYLGRLPPDTRQDDVNKFFDGFGRIVDCRVMTGFGFVEFESSRDADDALQHFQGKPFMGQDIVLEFAKESRPRERPAYDDRPRARRPPGHRIIVSGVSRDTSWQDLKDFGREGGNVSYADIDRDHPGDGILEYMSREEAERAAKDLDGKELRGRSVRVLLDDSARGGADNYRRDDRRDDRPARDDRDRYRDDRGYGGGRARSRSPGGRDDRGGYGGRPRSRSPRHDDRRRSPPRRDHREHDDRRGGPDDRRDDRRPSGVRDDHDRRRGDERKEERFDDRPARPANAEPAGYSR